MSDPPEVVYTAESWARARSQSVYGRRRSAGTEEMGVVSRDKRRTFTNTTDARRRGEEGRPWGFHSCTGTSFAAEVRRDLSESRPVPLHSSSSHTVKILKYRSSRLVGKVRGADLKVALLGSRSSTFLSRTWGPSCVTLALLGLGMLQPR